MNRRWERKKMTPPTESAAIHAPGIYFGMPEAEYHADESFSASGAKNLLVSPLTFWTRSNLNPRRKDEQTPAMKFGSACDKLIVEGPEAFSEAYAVRPRIEDYPDAIDGVEALRERCAELGLKKGGRIDDLCARIREADPSAVLWPDLMRAFDLENIGREIISADWHRDIIDCAQIVRNHPDVAKAFSGGYPQVSIFWAKGGVPRKCRVDYLKTKAALDLKTFSNPFDRPISEAVAAAMANQKYGIQAVFYKDGIETIKQVVHSAPTPPVFGTVDGHWMDAFLACEGHRFGFVFVERGDTPNVEGRWFDEFLPNGQPAGAYEAAQARYEWACDEWLRWTMGKGRAPWIESRPMRAFEDHEFPMHMMN